MIISDPNLKISRVLLVLEGMQTGFQILFFVAGGDKNRYEGPFPNIFPHFCGFILHTGLLPHWIFPANLRWIGLPTIMVLVFYWLCRIAFVVMYPEMFAKLTIGDWFSFIILSLRFDASTIASIDLVFWVILLLPFHFHRNVYGILKWTFVVANSLFLPAKR